METDPNQIKQAPESGEANSFQEIPKPAGLEVRDTAARFRGNGTSFKAKLIGIDDVAESRGDKMCQDSILKLKAAVKASGQHKPKIIINVSLKGLRIINLMTGEIAHEHPVHRISFIARDLTDRRAFGYIFGAGEGKHQFFGIKTSKIAEHLVLALRDLFQLVYDIRKKEMEEAKKKNQAEENEEETYAVPNNRPAQQTDNNLLAMEQQLQDIQGLNDLEAFNPWPADTPVSPDTPGSPMSTDAFGIANLSDISSVSSDFSLASSSGTFHDQKLEGRPSRGNSFHRTNSGKSNISWPGRSASSHQLPVFRSDRKKRHGSIGCKDSELTSKPPAGKTAQSVTDKDSTEENKSATDITDQNNTNTEDSSSIKQETTTENVSDAQDKSFFDEVMLATGISSQTANDGIHDVITNNNLSSSLSSMSSTNSKSSTPRKSLSLSNFFSSKSDKKKKSQHKGTPLHNDLSIQKATSSDQIASIQGTSRLQRASSSSSNASIDQISWSKNHSPTTSLNNMSMSKVVSRTHSRERILPSASIARSRPRAQSSLSKLQTSKENPPMFKTKQTPISEKEQVNTIQEQDSQQQSSQTSSNTQWANFNDVTVKNDDDSAENCFPNDSSKSAWPESNGKEEQDASSNIFSDSFAPTITSSEDPAEDKTAPINSKLERTVFDDYDPFGEMTVEDPFSNITDVFGNMLNEKSPSPSLSQTSDKVATETDAQKTSESVSKQESSPDLDSPQETPEHETENRENILENSSVSSFEILPGYYKEEISDPEPSDLARFSPPPLPPRVPRRRSPSMEESESLPPLIPPPDLPTSFESSSGDKDDDSDVETSFSPPHSPPPDLPPLEEVLPPIPTRNSTLTRLNDADSLQEESPASSSESDGINQPARNKSYGDDLAMLDTPAAQPAAAPGAKLTKDQILAGFGPSTQQQAGYQQQMAAMQMQGFQQQPASVPVMGVQPGYAPPAAGYPLANPFGQNFPQVSQQPAFGGFPSGPSPAVPARPGAMRPPVAVVAQTGAAQNPFGDALSPMAGVMSPLSSDNKLRQDAEPEADKKKGDPFASLLPGMGATTGETNKKDMFKNFQMAKPQPPPRSGENVSANFESYLLNAVGGVPTDEPNNNPIKPEAPVPAPRSVSTDAFGIESPQAAVNGTSQAASDPFAMFSSPGEPFNFSNQPQQQQQQQNAPLFG